MAEVRLLMDAADGNECPDQGDDAWTTDTIIQRLGEIRELLRDLDQVELNDTNSLFFQHGFWELSLAVRDMLEIFDRRTGGKCS